MARKPVSNRSGKKQAARSGARAGKVGSSPKSAKTFGGKMDFGVEQKPRLAEFSKRKSREAKFTPAGSHLSDPRQEIGSVQAARVSGVGKSNAGPGGASGGDLDPDVVGVGDGRGFSQAGPDDKVWGPEWTTGGSEEMASGGPAKGENQGGESGRIAGSKAAPRSTVDRSGRDETTSGSGSGKRVGEAVEGRSRAAARKGARRGK